MACRYQLSRDPVLGRRNQAFPTVSAEANNMIMVSKETYNLFCKAFGRDSYNGAGATMDAIFNRGDRLSKRFVEWDFYLVLSRASRPMT